MMPRNLIKKMMPNDATIREHKHLRVLGTWLHDPGLWHLNRRSVSGAVAVGLFNAWIPVPFQMLLSAVAAIFFKVNLPISVVLVWLTNPLSMPPMFYGAYRLGAYILGEHHPDFHFELTLEWLTTGLGQIWEPFLLGCAILAVLSALLGFIAVRIAWRFHVIQSWKNRHMKKTRVN